MVLLFWFIHLVLEWYFSAIEDILEIGFELLGIVVEAQVGEVYAVDRAFAVGAVEVLSVDIVEVSRIFGLEFQVVLVVFLVLLGQILAIEAAEALIAILLPLDHEDGDLGTQSAQ